MMFDVLLGPSPRKKMDKVALPTRRVFPRTGNVIGRLGGIENILNPPPQPSCRFGGGSPDRHQNCDHVIAHDLAARFFKKRFRLCSDYVLPLLPVLLVSPGLTVSVAVLF